MASNTRHFARLLLAQTCPLEASLSNSISAFSRGMKTAPTAASTAAAARAQPAGMSLPTLGNTGVKFNSSRWAGPMAEENISVFDTAAAFRTLQAGPDASALRAMHPAALAHAERIARAQQMSASVAGFRLLPDLTPGRAFMWGTILAVWAVGSASLLAARALDIHSFAEVPEKMRQHLAPTRVWLQQHMGVVHDTMHMTEKPKALQQLKMFGGNVNQRFGARPVSEQPVPDMPLH